MEIYGTISLPTNIYCTVLWAFKDKYRQPLNNMDLNCTGPLICEFFSINTFSTTQSVAG